MQPPILKGKRVAIEPMKIEHVEGLFEAGNDERIWAYMPMKIATVDAMKTLVDKALTAKEEGTEFPFTIVDLETNTIVGSTRFLAISEANRGLEIGWTWHHPGVWRSRVNTECKYLLLRYCFETLSTIRVEFKTDARNGQSQKALERLGALKEGTRRNHRILPDGYIRDSVYFSIIESEWPKVKQHLAQLLER
nr:GNAT family N-acetyltransferase [Aureibacillus halotolerans]